jgi:hypothetical protein
MKKTYRVFRKTIRVGGSEAFFYEVNQVYYDEFGEIESWTPLVLPFGDTVEDLESQWREIMFAFKKSFVDEESLKEIIERKSRKYDV